MSTTDPFATASDAITHAPGPSEYLTDRVFRGLGFVSGVLVVVLLF